MIWRENKQNCITNNPINGEAYVLTTPVNGEIMPMSIKTFATSDPNPDNRQVLKSNELYSYTVPVDQMYESKSSRSYQILEKVANIQS